MEINAYFLLGMSLGIPFHCWFFNKGHLDWFHKFFAIAIGLAAMMFPVYLPT